LVAPEDGQIRQKHAGLYDYLIIKKVDTLEGNIMLIFLVVFHKSYETIHFIYASATDYKEVIFS
jgi:hypothetical protein